MNPSSPRWWSPPSPAQSSPWWWRGHRCWTPPRPARACGPPSGGVNPPAAGPRHGPAARSGSLDRAPPHRSARRARRGERRHRDPAADGLRGGRPRSLRHAPCEVGRGAGDDHVLRRAAGRQHPRWDRRSGHRRGSGRCDRPPPGPPRVGDPVARHDRRRTVRPRCARQGARRPGPARAAAAERLRRRLVPVRPRCRRSRDLRVCRPAARAWRSRSSRIVLGFATGAVAAAVAATRVLLGAHWFTDVLAGTALGWGWFALCSIAYRGRTLRFGRVAAAADLAP